MKCALVHCRAPDRLGEQPVEGRTIVKSPGDDDSSNFAGVADIGERIIVQEHEIPSRSPVTAQRNDCDYGVRRLRFGLMQT